VVGCLLVSLIITCAPTWAAAPSGFDPQQVDRLVASGLGRIGFPGMAVVITHGSQVVYLRGFGSAGHGRSVTAATQFRLASLSKSFTALAVLQLVQVGRVDLDAPARSYVPNFTTADPAGWARITVRQLLNQTSGMADAGFPAVASDQPSDLAARVTSLHRAVLVTPPGQQFHYFNPNYQVLARLVELVTGMPFGEYLREQVLRPLGMNDTLSTPTTSAGTRAAHQLADGHILVFDVPVARAELGGLVDGEAGVISTAADMGQWLIAHTTGATPGGQRLLDPAVLAVMHTPPPGIGSDYAMGWQVIAPAPGQPRRIEHTGVLSTFSADEVLLPDSGYGFALLYNANSALADTAGIKTALACLLAGDTPPDGVRSTATVATLFGVLSLAVGALRVRQLIRVRRWAQRPSTRHWWALVPGLITALIPFALLAALPSILLAVIGRSFTFWQLCLSMPDPMIFVALAGITGVAVQLARLIELARRPQHSA
jgi:CubicO group peptidase (beta-lactamase class C family)